MYPYESNGGVCPHSRFIEDNNVKTCVNCGEVEDDSSPLDEPWDIDPELMDFWRSRSEFAIPDCFEIGHIVEGRIE